MFSPLAALRARHERCETHRDQPVKPRQTGRRIRPRYTAKTYARAIARACTAADIPGSSSNQLRHNAATGVAERHGLELAAAVLGHARVETTQLYAPINVQKAVAVMLVEN